MDLGAKVGGASWSQAGTKNQQQLEAKRVKKNVKNMLFFFSMFLSVQATPGNH